MLDYKNRRYLIIPSLIKNQIDFNEVEETSVDTLRFSIDGSKTFVKYYLPNRPSIYLEEYEELTHNDMCDVLLTDEWSDVKNIYDI